MKYILFVGYWIAYMLAGMYLENIGIRSPPFFAFYGGASVIGYIALTNSLWPKSMAYNA